MIVHDDIGDNGSKQHSLLLKVMDNLAFGVGFQKQFIKAKIGVYCIQCGKLNIIRKVSSANVREKYARDIDNSNYVCDNFVR